MKGEKKKTMIVLLIGLCSKATFQSAGGENTLETQLL